MIDPFVIETRFNRVHNGLPRPIIRLSSEDVKTGCGADSVGRSVDNLAGTGYGSETDEG
jgi:hypothetical protein